MMRRFNILKWAAYALVIFLLAVFQQQIGFYPKVLGVTPLFLIPAVISVAMQEGETAGGIFGAVGGLIWDCGTGHVFGFNALFLMAFCIAIGLFVKFLLRASPFSSLVFTVGVCFIHELITWFFFCYMMGSGHFLFSLVRIILPTTGLTALFALPFFYGARALKRLLTTQDGDSPI